MKSLLEKFKKRGGDGLIPAFTTGLVAVAVLLCLAHYLSFRSLWLDEASVAANVRTKSLLALFGPLEYNQHFPRLYLSVVYGVKTVFGYHLWSLRLLPLLFGIGAILLGSRILWDEFQDESAWPFLSFLAVLLFLGNHFIYYYAGEFKQYSADLFWSLVAYRVGRRLYPAWREGSVPIVQLCLLALPILLSLTYTFVLLAVIAAFHGSDLLLRPGRGRTFLRLLPAGVFIVFLVEINYQLGMKYANSDSLHEYWAAFFIHGPSLKDWVFSAWKGLSEVLGRWWVKPLTPGFVALAALGAVGNFSQIKTNSSTNRMGVVGFVLILELLFLAAWGKYPMECGRMGLFFFPFACAMITGGFRFMVRSSASLVRWPGWTGVAAVSFLMLAWKMPVNVRSNVFVNHWENINEALGEIENKKPRIVVVGTATHIQVEAAPNLPNGPRYKPYSEIHLTDTTDETKEMLDHGFYFLEATPKGEPAVLLNDLNKIRPFDQINVMKHLSHFKPKDQKP